MSNKFTGLDNINKPAFDASKKLLKVVQKALESKANVYQYEGEPTDFFYEDLIVNPIMRGSILIFDSWVCIVSWIMEDDSITLCGLNDDGTLLSIVIYPYHGVPSSFEVELNCLYDNPSSANKLLGFDNNGALTVVNKPSGGSQLYKHTIVCEDINDIQFTLTVINTNSSNNLTLATLDGIFSGYSIYEDSISTVVLTGFVDRTAATPVVKLVCFTDGEGDFITELTSILSQTVQEF